MAYTKQTWTTGETVVASKMNNIEQGIKDNSDDISTLNTNLWGPGTSIPSNSDLDNYTTVGRYYVADSSTSSTISNGPGTGAGYALIVLNLTTGVISQIAIRASGSTGNILYARTRTNSAWNSWYRFTSEAA